MSDHDHLAPDDPPDVGSVQEEAAKLFGALTDLARDQAGPAGWGHLAAQAGRAAQDAVAEVDAHLATGSAECRWCPVCRVVHAVRESAGPEVRTHLAAAASSLLQAAAQLLEPPTQAPARADAQPPTGGGGDDVARTAGEGRHDVQHIDLDSDLDGPREPREPRPPDQEDPR